MNEGAGEREREREKLLNLLKTIRAATIYFRFENITRRMVVVVVTFLMERLLYCCTPIKFDLLYNKYTNLPIREQL